MKKRQPKEQLFYPIVERWMRRHFLCFKTAINTGLKHGRIDVFGLRDMGGDLANDVELVAIEVKRGVEPFATACGQALGYQVYAHRIYLADTRETSFSSDEIRIANKLGVGLIQIKKGKCSEILSSPHYEPISSLYHHLLERIAHGVCQFCGSVFEIGRKGNLYARVSKENVSRAAKSKKGLIFWNEEVSLRKHRLKLRPDKYLYERRFVCSDCVSRVFYQFTKG